MDVLALMVPLTVLVDPVVDLEVCCKVNSVVIRLVVLVKVVGVAVKVVSICRLGEVLGPTSTRSVTPIQILQW